MLGGFKLFSTALWAPSLAALSRVVNHHWIARSRAVSRRGNSFGVLWVLPRYFWLNQSGLVNEDSHLFDGKIRKIIQHNPAKLWKGETYIYIIIYIYTLWLFNIAMENGPVIDDFPSHGKWASYR